MFWNFALLCVPSIYSYTTSDSVSFSLPVLPGDYWSLDTQRGQVRDFLDGEVFQINPRLPWWLLVASCSVLGCPQDPIGHHSPISFPFCFPLSFLFMLLFYHIFNFIFMHSYMHVVTLQDKRCPWGRWLGAWQMSALSVMFKSFSSICISKR